MFLRIDKDLIDPKYKGLIWVFHPTPQVRQKLIINTVIQKYGQHQGIQYLVDLDKNIAQYTKSGSGSFQGYRNMSAPSNWYAP